jgi:GT2 family glycosyltransferase
VLDNNTDDDTADIYQIIHECQFPVPVIFRSEKHGDRNKTHAWSSNTVVKQVSTPWVFFTRADYLLAFDALRKFVAAKNQKPEDWNGFVTSSGSHLALSVESCEVRGWRNQGPQIFSGDMYDYTHIDTGVWLARRDAFERVGGLNEQLSAWGHAQTHFQWKLHKSGVEFVRVPEVLFFHPAHEGEKDLSLAKRQVDAQGLSLQEMWARYEGPRMY